MRKKTIPVQSEQAMKLYKRGISENYGFWTQLNA